MWLLTTHTSHKSTGVYFFTSNLGWFREVVLPFFDKVIR